VLERGGREPGDDGGDEEPLSDAECDRMAAEANRMEMECARLWQEGDAVAEEIGVADYAAARLRAHLQARA
jgi:outer membrane murein-binding lipoprotein Lpp